MISFSHVHSGVGLPAHCLGKKPARGGRAQSSGPGPKREAGGSQNRQTQAPNSESWTAEGPSSVHTPGPGTPKTPASPCTGQEYLKRHL